MNESDERQLQWLHGLWAAKGYVKRAEGDFLPELRIDGLDFEQFCRLPTSVHMKVTEARPRGQTPESKQTPRYCWADASPEAHESRRRFTRAGLSSWEFLVGYWEANGGVHEANGSIVLTFSQRVPDPVPPHFIKEFLGTGSIRRGYNGVYRLTVVSGKYRGKAVGLAERLRDSVVSMRRREQLDRVITLRNRLASSGTSNTPPQ